MSLLDANERRRQAAEQAAAWLVDLRLEQLSVQQRREFVDWLRESPVHIAEMLRVARMHRSLSEFSQWPAIAAAAASGVDNVIPLNAGHAAFRRGSRAAWFWAMAASFAAVVFAAWLLLRPEHLLVQTQIGERRELSLADGSVVNVAPASELRVQLAEHDRVVQLASGQAFFRVAKDERRPFIVQAGDTRVRAVGTAFEVMRSGAGVKVTVLEGRVLVTSANSVRLLGAERTATGEIPLSANQQLELMPDAETQVREVNGAAAVAWTDGNLVFNDEPVAEIVRRFNLHNRTQIRILGAELAARRVSGVFKVSDPESFVAFLRTAAGDAGEVQGMIRIEEPTQ